MKKTNTQNNVLTGGSASGMILRTALTKKMRDKSVKKNIFLTAPGGFGKTVAAMQWLSSANGATARLLIGEADNNPGVFYRRLMQVLLKLTGKEKGFIDVDLSLDGLLETLHLLPQKATRCYLILDDMHMLKSEEILNSLPLIVNRLPRYICLCLISRSEPSVHLLEAGRFEMLTKDDLVFTLEEIEWLGAEKDYSLTPEQVKALLEATGGWAMYLSALLSGDRIPDILHEGKAPKTLLQYLNMRVWNLWDRKTKNLLIRLAVPVEITPELCERLTGCGDGRGILELLIKKENAFLSAVSEDTYRFHDVFRSFLLSCMNGFLGKDEIRQLNDIAAGWYYEQGAYFSGTRHYILNKDQEGINRCMRAVNRFHEMTGSISVEVRLYFIKQYVWNLTPEFIIENPYLISKCAVMAYHDGNAAAFLRYADLMYQKLPTISEKYPDLVENTAFISGLDFRMKLNEIVEKAAKTMPLMRRAVSSDTDAKSSTITQNLPFFHRSMRDFSECYELKKDEFERFRETYGVIIGRDYKVMEQSFIGGIYYERGELLDALRFALNGYYFCKEDIYQPETVFSSYMILGAVLYAMGAAGEANRIMEQVGVYIENKADFLRPNYKALQTDWMIRSGNMDVAGEWLSIYANHSRHLPFYQICRHFTTLRAHIAVRDFAEAIRFGKRLLKLTEEYNRPLDQVESSLLTAIALWHSGEKNKAVRQAEQAINIAMPYGFVQLFVGEGSEILPLLWMLKERQGKSAAFMRFVEELTEKIYARHHFEPSKEILPRLSQRQRSMLGYMNQGMSYHEIAEATGLARGTVKTHVLLVYKRLGVHSMKEAVVKARMLGFLE